MENILVFDTETTGLPIDWKAPMADLSNWPRVIQLAWGVYSPSGGLISENKHLIYPDGWQVPTGKFWIDNGFSTEQCESEGLVLPDVLDSFLGDLSKCGIMVAHNMSYDHNVLGSEMIRYGKKSTHRPVKVCTKNIGTDVCKIPSPNGRGYKWPKLSELHTFLFGHDFEGAHDAGFDVSACAKCFFELMAQGFVK